MTRHEADREDLMAEATALRERIELELPGHAEHVVAGFRENGNLSVFFGPDPMYQFDATGGLRRAFVAGHLYRSDGHTLARLTRMRQASAVNLVRHDLDAAELAQFLTEMTGVLARLSAALEQDSVRVVQQIAAAGGLQARLLRALDDARQRRLSPAISKRT